MKKIRSVPAWVLALTFGGAGSALAQTMIPLATFGGDGWLAPGENALLGTGNNERGLAYNSTNNNLYFVSRTGGLTIPILNGSTGVQTGTLNADTTVITGGTFALSKIVAAADGAIYATNLRTGATLTQTFKAYKWANEAAAPVNFFDALPDGIGRLGDNLDVSGTGAATQLLAGYGASTATNSNGYVLINPTASALTPTTPVFTNITFPEGALGTVDGDFRLGITFLTGGTTGMVLGTQGISPGPRLTSYDASTGQGTLISTLSLTTLSERAFDTTTVGGVNVLATLDTNSNDVRIYNINDPSAPSLLASGNATTGAAVTNGNSAGDVRWGAISGDTATLYALNTNNGIQAFTVVIPEPASTALLGAVALGFAARRRRSAA